MFLAHSRVSRSRDIADGCTWHGTLQSNEWNVQSFVLGPQVMNDNWSNGPASQLRAVSDRIWDAVNLHASSRPARSTSSKTLRTVYTCPRPPPLEEEEQEQAASQVLDMSWTCNKATYVVASHVVLSTPGGGGSHRLASEFIDNQQVNEGYSHPKTSHPKTWK